MIVGGGIEGWRLNRGADSMLRGTEEPTFEACAALTGKLCPACMAHQTPRRSTQHTSQSRSEGDRAEEESWGCSMRSSALPPCWAPVLHISSHAATCIASSGSMASSASPVLLLSPSPPGVPLGPRGPAATIARCMPEDPLSRVAVVRAPVVLAGLAGPAVPGGEPGGLRSGGKRA